MLDDDKFQGSSDILKEEGKNFFADLLKSDKNFSPSTLLHHIPNIITQEENS
jgi:hypothetical protein